MRQQNTGLTALELLITLSLVILLMAAGFPGLREYRLNQQMRSAVTLLFSEFRFARSEAIALNSRTVICPAEPESACSGHSQWHRGWLVFADTNGDSQWQNREPVLRRGNSLSGLSALGHSSRTLVRFFPGGAAPGSNTGVVLCDQRGLSKGVKIVVSNSGRIRQSSLTTADSGLCTGMQG